MTIILSMIMDSAHYGSRLPLGALPSMAGLFSERSGICRTLPSKARCLAGAFIAAGAVAAVNRQSVWLGLDGRAHGLVHDSWR